MIKLHRAFLIWVTVVTPSVLHGQTIPLRSREDSALVKGLVKRAQPSLLRNPAALSASKREALADSLMMLALSYVPRAGEHPHAGGYAITAVEQLAAAALPIENSVPYSGSVPRLLRIARETRSFAAREAVVSQLSFSGDTIASINALVTLTQFPDVSNLALQALLDFRGKAGKDRLRQFFLSREPLPTQSATTLLEYYAVFQGWRR
jgi:hypothetical protein